MIAPIVTGTVGPQRAQQREKAPRVIIGLGYRGCAAQVASFSDVRWIAELVPWPCGSLVPPLCVPRSAAAPSRRALRRGAA
jgi:hypothetical protein